MCWAASSRGRRPTDIGPGTSSRENCEMGYGSWLAAMLGGGVTGSYETLRWRFYETLRWRFYETLRWRG
jgi:hypothetical protein